MQYTLDDGVHDEPGTAAYYKSWTFRQKVNEGSTIVPRQENEAGADIDDGTEGEHVRRRDSTKQR